MALHAWRMALRHPLTGVPLEFVAPLPGSLAGYIAAVDAGGVRDFTADDLSLILGTRRVNT
jgi:23S rRNA pseudouridine955/2504/2580 synthase